MRDIKFRVWDKRTKSFECTEGVQVIETDTWNGSGKNGKGEWFDSPTTIMRTVDDEDLVFMQYTGLKDKNGKEIYEGDIVNGGEIVSWRGGAWGYDNIVWSGSIEVLGNIYENPELSKLTK